MALRLEKRSDELLKKKADAIDVPSVNGQLGARACLSFTVHLTRRFRHLSTLRQRRIDRLTWHQRFRHQVGAGRDQCALFRRRTSCAVRLTTDIGCCGPVTLGQPEQHLLYPQNLMACLGTTGTNGEQKGILCDFGVNLDIGIPVVILGPGSDQEESIAEGLEAHLCVIRMFGRHRLVSTGRVRSPMMLRPVSKLIRRAAIMYFVKRWRQGLGCSLRPSIDVVITETDAAMLQEDRSCAVCTCQVRKRYRFDRVRRLHGIVDFEGVQAVRREEVGTTDPSSASLSVSRADIRRLTVV